jgi:DNA-binding NarL/FixJ family response regulator
MTTSVILIDDHELIRQGLRRAFERDPDFEVVGEAGSGSEAREKVQSLGPDVVIVDVRLPDVNGLELAKELRAGNPRLGIVILTMYSGDEQAVLDGRRTLVFLALLAGDLSEVCQHCGDLHGP